MVEQKSRFSTLEKEEKEEDWEEPVTIWLMSPKNSSLLWYFLCCTDSLVEVQVQVQVQVQVEVQVEVQIEVEVQVEVDVQVQEQVPHRMVCRSMGLLITS